MLRAACNCALIGLFIVYFGCSQSSNPSQTIQPRLKSKPDPIDALLTQYQQLPDEQRNGLSGDQIIIQIEALLKSNTSQAPSEAAGVVVEHNKRMLRRALEDPDLLEVTGTELAPTPRER
jgi:hypothetical protein